MQLAQRLPATRNLAAHLVGWLVLPLFAIANGALRELTYGRVLTEVVAHSISVVPLLAAIALWALWLARRYPLPSARDAALVGVVWLVATVGFELGLGAAQGAPLRELLGQYDVTRGNLWVLVPLTTLVAPPLARR